MLTVSSPDDESRGFTELFKSFLHLMMCEAMRSGKKSMEVSAAELHGRFHSYSGRSRMPECCQAMREALGAEDAILEEAQLRQPGRLRIAYALPRHPRASMKVS